MLIFDIFEPWLLFYQKEKLPQNQNSHQTHGQGSVLSQVQYHVQLYHMTPSSSF